MNEPILLAQEFINKVRQSGISITHAALFGSWAKGKATKDSDIDVCLVSPSFGRDYIQEMVELRKISLSIDSRIEPIPLTIKDFNDPLATLASEIRKHSINLL